jgi:hypothetical protein
MSVRYDWQEKFPVCLLFCLVVRAVYLGDARYLTRSNPSRFEDICLGGPGPIPFPTIIAVNESCPVEWVYGEPGLLYCALVEEPYTVGYAV